MFNWTDCSDEELAQHVATTPATNTTNQLKYYERIGNTDMVDRITKARTEAKKWRILLKAKELGATLPSLTKE